VIVLVAVDFGVGVEGLAGDMGLPIAPLLYARPIVRFRVGELA
jgi:hypothetical protein